MCACVNSYMCLYVRVRHPVCDAHCACVSSDSSYAVASGLINEIYLIARIHPAL